MGIATNHINAVLAYLSIWKSIKFLPEPPYIHKIKKWKWDSETVRQWDSESKSVCNYKENKK